MKKIFYSIKDKIVTAHNIDFGVLVLFSIVTILFLISFIKIYI
jgi:hypothetical protein